MLLTVGLETPRQLSSAALKAWDVGSSPAASAAAPQCTCTIKVFVQKLAEAEVVSLAAHAEKLPVLRAALSLSSGQILSLHGSCQGGHAVLVLVLTLDAKLVQRTCSVAH